MYSISLFGRLQPQMYSPVVGGGGGIQRYEFGGNRFTKNVYIFYYILGHHEYII